MRLYYNRAFLRLIFEANGSVVWRRNTMMAGTVLALMSAALQWLVDSESPFAPVLPHHYAMHALGVIVAFAIVFRTNLGWQRYWEAVTQLHFMYSKWADAYSQFYAFAAVTIQQQAVKGTAEARDKIERVQSELDNVENCFHLMSAFASDRLMHGDAQRMERRAEVAGWRDQIINRIELRDNDLTGATKLPKFIALGGPRRNTHKDVALENNWEAKYVIRNMPDNHRIALLEESADRTNMVMHWILYSLATLSKDIDIAPPIQSRMYQELSNGMLGFSNALKIADVPFPFPYAQLLTIVLFLYSLFIPVYITCFTDSMILGPIMTFFLFHGVWCVNEVAKELENPFGNDSNDICLPDFHARFIDACNDIHIAHCEKKVDRCSASYQAMPTVTSLSEVILEASEKQHHRQQMRQQQPPELPEEKPVETEAPPPEHLHAQALQLVAQDATKDGALVCNSVVNPPEGQTKPILGEPPCTVPRRGEYSAAIFRQSAEIDDRRLQHIHARMEKHLAKMCKDLESITHLASSFVVSGQVTSCIGIEGRMSGAASEGGARTSAGIGPLQSFLQVIPPTANALPCSTCPMQDALGARLAHQHSAVACVSQARGEV